MEDEKGSAVDPGLEILEGEWPELEALKASRDDRSVLKMRALVRLSSSKSNRIFAFEGDDDRIIFSRWLARLRDDLSYEPYVCDGKREARKLSVIVCEDEGDLRNAVWLFVDRDFDDINGFCDIGNVFVTDCYSVENYLASPDTLRCVLRDEFPLGGLDGLKEEILETFVKLRSQFIEVVRAHNRRLHCAVSSSIRRSEPITARLSAIANVKLDKITPSGIPETAVILLDREPTAEEWDLASAFFDELEPTTRYRGKFFYQFFRTFLRQLEEICRKGAGPFFAENPRSPIRSEEFTLGNFAARSPMPEELGAFVDGIP